MVVDIEKVIGWYESHKGKLTYSMEGSRNGADGTADCSGSMVQAIYEAGATKPAWLYNTDTMHPWLVQNGFKLISENKDFEAERGDVIIWGKQGESGGDKGHVMILTSGEPDPKEVSCDFSTKGEKGTAVQEYDYNRYLAQNDYPYSYIYRLEKVTPAPPPPPPVSGGDGWVDTGNRHNELSGGFSATGYNNNVVLGGSPNGSYMGMDLSQAHANNVGWGLVTNGYANAMRMTVSFVAYATGNSGNPILNQSYVHYGGLYSWELSVEVSNDKSNFTTVYNNKRIFDHDGSQDWDLAYKGNWLRTAQNSQGYLGEFNFTGWDWVRVTIKGANSTQVNPVIFNISDLIPTYKPMASYKNNDFKTLSTPTGYINTFKDKEWKDISLQGGKDMRPHNFIYKSGDFRTQGKIGH